MREEFQQIIADMELQYRLPGGMLAAVVEQESGFNPRAVSPAGAQGLTQLMPGTARGLGVTDPFDPVQNLDGGARYLRQQLDRFNGDVRLALAAYNAGPGAVARYGGVPPYKETQGYVSRVLERMGQGPRSPVVSNPFAPAAASAAPAPPPTLPALDEALTSVINRNNALLGVPELPAGLLFPTPKTTAAPGPVTAPRVTGNPFAPLSSSPAAPSSGDPSKWVKVATNADRHGVTTRPEVVSFVGDVGALYGKPVTITTGTHHNQFVKGTNRESRHWTGWAADIAARGDELTRLGRSALIAAGMDPEQAYKVRGGLFNVGGWQIIFNTDEGGNHWDHLHVGRSR